MTEFFHIPYGDHPSQFGVLRMPNFTGPSPVVITIHGGFWQSKYNLEENTPLDEDLTRRGYATWNIEYRRVGEDGGGWPGTLIDVIDTVNYLTQLEESFQIDLSHVVILGHSAGGTWHSGWHPDVMKFKRTKSVIICLFLYEAL